MPKKKSNPPSRRRRIGRRLAVVVSITFVTFVGLSVAVTAIFRWLPPPASAIMLSRSISENVHYEYQWIPLQDISPAAALAVVAAEDQKFPHHSGFDFGAISDAMEHNLKGGRTRGASTISQQVAKNLFLWEGRTWVRKGLEAWFTALIESIWPKRRILEVYLNIAEMGHRVYGVRAASLRFYRVAPIDISDEHAALLAAVLPNPRRFRVEAPSPYVRERQRWILNQMQQLGGPQYLADVMH